MSYEFNAIGARVIRQLLPIPFILAFMLSVILISILLFPAKKLQRQVLSATQPQEITLYYLKQLVEYYPNKNSLRIALAEQEINSYHWVDADEQLSILEKNPQLKIDVRLLRFRLEYTKAYQLPHGEVRKKMFAKLQTDILNFTDLPLQKNQLLFLANAALNIEKPAVALMFYQQIKEINNPILYEQIAKTALQASQYSISAQYSMLAEKYQKTLELKRRDIITALQTLQQGGLFSEGLAILSKLPDDITNNKSMLIFLTQYALAANRPDIAQEYARRTLLLRSDPKL